MAAGLADTPASVARPAAGLAAASLHGSFTNTGSLHGSLAKTGSSTNEVTSSESGRAASDELSCCCHSPVPSRSPATPKLAVVRGTLTAVWRFLPQRYVRPKTRTLQLRCECRPLAVSSTLPGGGRLNHKYDTAVVGHPSQSGCLVSGGQLPQRFAFE